MSCYRGSGSRASCADWLPEARPIPFTPIHPRVLPTELPATSTYLSAGTFWQPVGMPQDPGPGRGG